MVLRKSFYIRWSAGRSPRVHEVNPGRDPSLYLIFQTLVVPSLITESKYHIQRYKNKTTTIVVFIVAIHTVLSPIYIYIYKNYTFTFT